MENNIKYLGLKDLDNFEIAKINDLTEKFFPKLERKAPDAMLTVHVKVMNREGNKSTYHIKVKLDSETVGRHNVEQSDIA